ncbi:MAG: hypothetical protein JSV24_02285, partial [Bacteroidales bacterium]
GDPSGTYVISIDDWYGTIANVRINGTLAGTVAWLPYEIDVTSFITTGRNLVEVEITGSLKNTLGYHHNEITGWIDGPWSWNAAPEIQPPGDKYHFQEYGLFGRIRMVNQVTVE